VDTDILLVDDDEDTCASMSDILCDLGYSVSQAHDGPSALQLAERHRYRMALLDFRMPGMDGLELCRRLKGLQPGVAAYLVTALASISSDPADSAGIRRVLSKPVDFALLLPLVKAAVGST
jgi:CheY-like chemotaxis protein